MSIYSHFSRSLDTNGDGTGTKNAIGDYSSVSDIFYLQPSATQFMSVARIIIGIRDNGVWSAATYGAIAGGLTNGIVMRKATDTGTSFTLTDTDIPIKNNAQWGYYCYDSTVNSVGSGDTFLLVRWTFERYGASLGLRGELGDRLEIVLNDNFTTLVEHYFIAEGIQHENA